MLLISVLGTEKTELPTIELNNQRDWCCCNFMQPPQGNMEGSQGLGICFMMWVAASNTKNTTEILHISLQSEAFDICE